MVHLALNCVALNKCSLLIASAVIIAVIPECPGHILISVVFCESLEPPSSFATHVKVHFFQQQPIRVNRPKHLLAEVSFMLLRALTFWK